MRQLENPSLWFIVLVVDIYAALTIFLVLLSRILAWLVITATGRTQESLSAKQLNQSTERLEPSATSIHTQASCEVTHWWVYKQLQTSACSFSEEDKWSKRQRNKVPLLRPGFPYTSIPPIWHTLSTKEQYSSLCPTELYPVLCKNVLSWMYG